MYYIITEELLHQSFEKDKNIILKAAQEVNFEKLSKLMASIVIDSYTTLFNPLGLVDDTYQRILDYQFDNTSELKGIYDNLGVAYRYKYGDNQLEIIWDGMSHEEKYAEEWSKTFKNWVNELSVNPNFVKGILQLSVFNDGDKNVIFVKNGLKAIINDFFEIKIVTRKGLKKVVVNKKVVKKAS